MSIFEKISRLFPGAAIALTQMEEGRGLKRLSFEAYQNIATALDQMNSPTYEQVALIKLTMEGKRYQAPQRWEQEKLLNLYKAKLKLEEVIELLGE